MASILGLYNRVRELTAGPVSSYPLYLPYIQGKTGIEIGGPSSSFRHKSPFPLYQHVGSLDNCDFSSDNVWAVHEKQFIFCPGKPAGRTFICEGSQLTPVASSSYDFVLSSHNLEHFANPVKALYEWKRVLRPGGALILVLPYYRYTFDHHRTPTPVAHMFEDFNRNIGEDDLTHLPEILEKHDLSRDLAAGSPDAFKQRSLNNLKNRCLHHHVFDEFNSKELLTTAGFTVVASDRAHPIHLCLLSHI